MKGIPTYAEHPRYVNSFCVIALSKKQAYY